MTKVKYIIYCQFHLIILLNNYWFNLKLIAFEQTGLLIVFTRLRNRIVTVSRVIIVTN